MTELAPKIQETVHLAVLSDTEIFYVDKVDSPEPLGSCPRSVSGGLSTPPALGKVLLAYQPEEEQSRIIRKIKSSRSPQ